MTTTKAKPSKASSKKTPAKKSNAQKKTPKAAQTVGDEPQASGLGLDGIGDLAGLLATPAASGGPLEISLDLIDEDPDQPRTEENPGFSSKSLKELAVTIKDRGVKTPISVRQHPEAPGRYIVNHGARRCRASKIAGLQVIPGFVDNDYNSVDQVVENLQRDALTPREIADYIGRQLAAGRKKGEIAKDLGKSAAFVSQHVTLLDLPEPVAEAFNAGRLGDVTLISEIVKAFKKYPEEVVVWLADDSQEITRRGFGIFREYLEAEQARPRQVQQPKPAQSHEDEADDEAAPSAEAEGTDLLEEPEPSPNDDDRGQADTVEASGQIDLEDPAPSKSQSGVASQPESDPTKLKRSIVMVQYRGERARLMLDRRPSAEGFAWLKAEEDGEVYDADLKTVRILSLIEA